MHFLASPPRHLFFTGKGGVGKTSIACASAVALARAGRHVLIVSTDPASNVGQVFGLTVGNRVTPIPHVPGLAALEIDPEQAASGYRERIIAPVRSVLPLAEIEALTEQLSGSCTTEIASFDEFAALLADPEQTADYDHVVFDTAPTGHTLRLLQLPGDWTTFLDQGTGDASCLGPMSGLERNRATYRDAVLSLTDPAISRLVLVARAQQSTVREVARTQTELADLGIRATHLVINGVLPADEGDPLHVAIREREQRTLAALPPELSDLTVDHIALKPANMVGLAALDSLFSPTPDVGPAAAAVPSPAANLATLVDELASRGHGAVMTMGKGGVGKTTIAAAIALALSERGHKVHLTTTDPAAHLTSTLCGDVPGLTVDAIDPREATQTYRDRVMATKGRHLDDAGRAALHEDLMSPCTEEVAVFQQFSRAVNEARRQFVVIDTAPTGHTLLLMDATGSYHRDIIRHLDDDQRGRLTTPLMRLQDPAHTQVIIVTSPEPTPVLEAEALVDDLSRAGIRPWACVVNDSLLGASPTSPLLARRAHAEQTQVERATQLAPRLAVVATQAVEPVGLDALRGLVRH